MQLQLIDYQRVERIKKFPTSRSIVTEYWYAVVELQYVKQKQNVS